MKKLLLLLLLPLNPVVAQDESERDISLLCVADKSTGFYFREETQEWDVATFNVSNKRYTFSKTKDGQYAFKQFGEEYPISTCSGINEHGFGQCTDSVFDLTINVQSLRYQLIYPIGYAVAPEAVDDHGNTPSIEIGVCTNL